MLTITFKDVGHGDSIILEWEHQEQKKIAIIDCNISDSGSIPTLEYLKREKEYKHIEFVLLSHPHYDHFSGFNNLLDYCSKEKISIGVFMHTACKHPRFMLRMLLNRK